MTGIPILVVEDDILTGMETCDGLRDYGFLIAEVSCAQGAIRVLAEHPPLLALITDINLGPGEDGYDLARIARDAYPELPVIYVSGSPPDRHLAEGVKGSRFIAKPASPGQLADALFEMIDPGHALVARA